MKIEYAGSGNLYIPATGLDVIQKYAGGGAKAPKLNRLGTAEWNKTKTRVQGAVQDIAKDLVKLYAVRQSREGYAFGPDTVWQKEFEELFEYDETEDQLLAIEATKRDMTTDKLAEADTRRAVFRRFADRAKEEELGELLEEIGTLIANGQLFTRDEYERYIDEVKARKTVVKALCLHIAHDGHCDRSSPGTF